MWKLAMSAVCVCLVGCGGDPALDSAHTTVALSTRVLSDLEQRTAQGPGGFGREAVARAEEPQGQEAFATLRSRVMDAQRSLHNAEQAVDRWEEDELRRPLWDYAIPCLAQAMTQVREALFRFRIEPDVDFEQVHQMTTTEAGTSRCIVH